MNALDLQQLGPVDWARLSHPQDDQYDTAVFQRIAALRYGWQLQDPAPGERCWLGDRVPIRNPDSGPFGDSSFVHVDPADERWAWTAELAASWPAQHEQIRRLVNYVGGSVPPGNVPVCGCASGTPCGNPFFKHLPIEARYWGTVYATMHCGSGFCEGVAHELAHWKGYALGMFIEDWEPLLFRNEPPERRWIEGAPSRAEAQQFDPATRRLWLERGIGYQPFNTRMRPLGALFQELWCCMHMMAYHLRMLPVLEGHGGPFPGEPQLPAFRQWAEAHVVRSLRGHRDLVEIVQPTPAIGEAFWRGYCTWVDGMVEEARVAYGRSEPF